MQGFSGDHVLDAPTQGAPIARRPDAELHHERVFGLQRLARRAAVIGRATFSLALGDGLVHRGTHYSSHSPES